MKIREWAVWIITNKKWQVLLQDRASISKSWEDWWFFWWWIEFMEDPQMAAIRELKEELNIDIWKDDMSFIWMSHWHTLAIKPFSLGKSRKIRVHFFIIHTSIEEGDFTVLEWDWAKYFTLEEMKSLNKGITNFHEWIMFYEEYLLSSKIENFLPNNYINFIEILDSMKNIDRHVLLKNWKQENNAEHSYHLASIASILLKNYLHLDHKKVIDMCLFHDIVEVYAWDTPFLIDPEWTQTKQNREETALLQLEKIIWTKQFSYHKEMITEFMKKQSPEALFVYQLDKIQPIIQYVLEWWKWWKKWKYDKDTLQSTYKEIFSSDEFWLYSLVKHYFSIAEENNMFYTKS